MNGNKILRDHPALRAPLRRRGIEIPLYGGGTFCAAKWRGGFDQFVAVHGIAVFTGTFTPIHSYPPIAMNIDFTQLFIAATLLLAFVAVWDLLSRKRSAAFRHGIWAAAMFGLLILPFVQSFLPPLMQFGTSDASVLDVAWNRFQPLLSPHAIHAEPVGNDHPALSGTPPKEGNNRSSVGGAENSPTVVGQGWSLKHDTLLSACLSTCLAIILIVGVLRIVGIYLSHRSAARWLRESQPVDNTDILSLCRDIVRKFRISRPVRIVQHPVAEIPLVVSIRRPTVILPIDFCTKNREEWEAVLTHELAHIRRNDLFWQLVSQWTAVFYWYHPFLWYARYRMRLERETACDDMVLRSGGDPQRYASTLLEMAAKDLKPFERKLPDCTVPIIRANAVARRITDIVNPSVNRRTLSRLVMFGLVILFTATLALGVMVARQPSEAQRLYMIAVPNRDEMAKIRGTILLPDGTPPKECYVSMDAATYKNSSFLFRLSNGYSRKNGNVRSENGGTFELEVPVGANVILTTGTVHEFSAQPIPATPGFIQGKMEYKQDVYVSRPYAFSPKKENNDIALHLEKATSVAGKLRYDNGDPATSVAISAVQFVPAARGADIPRVRNESTVGTVFSADENGNFEFQLWPGEFTLAAGWMPWLEPVTKIIHVEQGKPVEVDLTIPTPLRINVVMPDGSPAGNFRLCQLAVYRPLWNKTGKLIPEVLFTTLYDARRWDNDPPFVAPERPIAMRLCREENYVTVMTEDNEYGIVRKLEPELMGQELTLTLRPTIDGTVQLSNAANEDVSILTRIIKVERNGDFTEQHGYFGPKLWGRTDADGRLDFKVPVFEGIDDSVWLCFKKGESDWGNASGSSTYRMGSWFRHSGAENRFKQFRPPADGKPFDLGVMEVER